jgi:surface antigen
MSPEGKWQGVHQESAMEVDNMNRKMKFGLGAFAMACLSFVTVPVNSQTYIYGSEIELTPKDRELLKQSLRDLLRNPTDSKISSWANQKSENSGTNTRTRRFTKNGLQCAEVVSVINAKGQNSKFTTPYCRISDGSWKIAH